MFPGVKTASLRTNQWLMTENNQPASAFHIATSKSTVYPLSSMSSHTWPLSVHLPNPQGQVPDNQGWPVCPRATELFKPANPEPASLYLLPWPLLFLPLGKPQ